ncbi:MAG TPA: hypothetical protein VN649_22720 [Ramlibacter sp.]|nr:hypothetical protein [Ramlibacter sp.]
MILLSHTWLRGAVLGLCLCTAAASAQNRVPADREQLERKLASTSTLIESSSGAKQIDSSGVAAAQSQRNRARDLHRQAGEALRAGQLEAAAKLLDDASRAMFEGVRLAAPEQVVKGKERADFDARMESTRALLEAQKRIAAEKSAGATAGELSRRVESLMAEAGELARGGRLADARRTLDQAYLTVKAAIGTLRGGDTVVRSLNFANKSEEYLYEIDRNDTHRMLVQVLLKDKRGTGGVDAMVDQSMAASARLRAQAEQEAARRDHEAAVRTLEQSTRELVKAIRGAGVYIPG